MPDYECDTTGRAMDLYFRLMRRRGVVSPAQPSRGSGREGDDVVLRNVHGELARYRLRPDGGMRLVRPHRKADA